VTFVRNAAWVKKEKEKNSPSQAKGAQKLIEDRSHRLKDDRLQQDCFAHCNGNDTLLK